MTTDNHFLHWKAGSAEQDLPPALKEFSSEEISLGCFGPRPTAWITTSDTGNQVSLLEGFNVANHGPPTIVLGTKLLPVEMRKALTADSPSLCTLSVGTTHQPYESFSKMARLGGETPIADISEIPGLEFEDPDKSEGYPSPAIATSPIHMNCRVQKVIPLDEESGVIFLEMERVVLDPSILTKPPPSDRSVLAIIDGPRTNAVVSFGLGKFGTTDHWFRMKRPQKLSGEKPVGGVSAQVKNGQGDYTTWHSPAFEQFSGDLGLMPFEKPLVYCFKDDPNMLGYNPAKSIVQPRPIGWISTFRKDVKIPHLAPYSFFSNLDADHIAFVGYRNQEGKVKKDAQMDSESTGCFVWNVATEELAVPVNLSAAELARDESEFELTGLEWSEAETVDAPMVCNSPIRFECDYVSSTESGNYSVVVGKIQSIHLRSDMVDHDSGGLINIARLRPITRCGYTDEYALTASEWNGKERENR